jgi:hypothetical protein
MITLRLAPQPVHRTSHRLRCSCDIVEALGVAMGDRTAVFIELTRRNAVRREAKLPLRNMRAEFSLEIQCTNYFKATGLQLCLLLNFGKPSLEIKRIFHGL